MIENTKDPFWEAIRKEFVDYMIKREGVASDVDVSKAEEFCKHSAIWSELRALIHNGSFNKDSKRVLKLVNAYELTKLPHDLSNMAALDALYDIVTEGLNCDAFQMYYTNEVMYSEIPEKTAKKLDKFVAKVNNPA